MGCKHSTPREKPPPMPLKSSLKSDKGSTYEDMAPEGLSNGLAHHTGSALMPSGSPYRANKKSFTNGLAGTDNNAFDDDSSNHFVPYGMGDGGQPIEELEDSPDSDDMNMSFPNVDFNGSFHIRYSVKVDITPNATLPESRRGRSVPPKLLAGLSPHSSDDDLVLLCTDCGMTIDENCELMCPLTGKLHI
ncbi:hypothetical protein ABL78_1928 [Leptomonas seymouri]|uniref:Uncharacterized protein n=1 Tax=Leptomonas seymouri TaxID=5684 RepID=A0A0N1PD07_LEPSE|nr:hypothetical protein ABL78_1928 [Leptomonas seymouri]|eukprot:KPI88962.1 hypothetical protein ABL78_1928 [Leptomonas seymouri]